LRLSVGECLRVGEGVNGGDGEVASCDKLQLLDGPVNGAVPAMISERLRKA
jgi:hypothetical protein